MRKLFGALALSLATLALPAQAAEWPERNVTVVVPFGAGGTTDMFARILAQAMQAKTGTPFVVENRPGAGGNIGSGAVAKAAPDGYTLLVGTVSTHAINPSLYTKMPYDAIRDFAPITLLASVPNIFISHPSFPPRTMNELVALAKRQPGKIVYASSGTGTPQHLSVELFKSLAGIDMVHVPYKGASPAVQAVLGGEAPISCPSLPSAGIASHIEAGRLIGLAVTGAKRSPTVPKVRR